MKIKINQFANLDSLTRDDLLKKGYVTSPEIAISFSEEFLDSFRKEIILYLSQSINLVIGYSGGGFHSISSPIHYEMTPNSEIRIRKLISNTRNSIVAMYIVPDKKILYMDGNQFTHFIFESIFILKKSFKTNYFFGTPANFTFGDGIKIKLITL